MQMTQTNRTPFKLAAAGLFLIVLTTLIFWLYSTHYVSTDDAYLNADVVRISPRLTGQVSRLYVVNNQFVKKGQVLFELDAAPLQIAVDKAAAQLAIDQANWQNATGSANRMMSLVKKNVLSQQTGDDATAHLKSAAAMVQLAEANYQQARLNLSYAKIVAPTDGWITNLSLQEGNAVVADQPVFAVISNSEFWVDANFKETELTSIRPHQKAVVKIDMYPHHVFLAEVESISGGSGTAFSLMPPQNATGNWVKITQRVPVRVRILTVNAKRPLRIGTSAKVTIDLHS